MELARLATGSELVNVEPNRIRTEVDDRETQSNRLSHGPRVAEQMLLTAAFGHFMPPLLRVFLVCAVEIAGHFLVKCTQSFCHGQSCSMSH